MDDNYKPLMLKPDNHKSLGVLGYLIVLNDQVHSYEMKALLKYLDDIGVRIEDTCLDAIIRGDDESISFAASVEAFSKEGTEVKICLLYLMFVLSCVDNHYASDEAAYINDICKCIDVSEKRILELKGAALAESKDIRAQNNTIFIRKPSERKKTIWQRIIAWIKRLLNRIRGIAEPLVENQGDNYKEAIEKCAEAAMEDLGVVEPAYRNVIRANSETVEKIEIYKRGLSLETGLSAGVAQTISSFINILNDEVVELTNHESDALEQKKRTISDFTISLIGRTKAGKSTLHAILTQQGKDRIGVGRQRTTRFNWVYQWNLLRIIDTPGIGSAEAGGRKDEEIAESVLGESDIICFVVADDSILKDILEFIEKIALLNKPVIILLNHKENIRPDVKFRRYVSAPRQWLSEEGESSLKGYENRIRKYANERGFGNLVSVYPVFLLPALMSEEDEYKDYRDVLWDNSNVEKFITQISSWVLKSGVIKRSQTILDETSRILQHTKDLIISSEETMIENQITSLMEQRGIKVAQLRETADEVVENVRSVLEERIGELARNEALTFAEKYIGEKNKAGKDVSDKWEAYIESIGFEKKLRDEIDREIGLYRDKADQTIRELFEDFYYAVNLALKEIEVSIPVQFDLKTASRVTFGILSVAGGIVLAVFGTSNPVGWVFSILAAIGGVGSGFFQSKGSRRQEAVNKVHTAVKSEIEKQAPEQIQKIVMQVTKELSDRTDGIESAFTDLISGLEWTKKAALDLADEYKREIERINKVYAWRIIRFLESKDACTDYDVIDREIVNVDRSENGRIVIDTLSPHRVKTEKLKTVLAENIIIQQRR